MKPILLAVLFGVASLSSLSTKAQVSLNVNIGSRPYYVTPARTQYVYVEPRRRVVVPYRYHTYTYRRPVVVVRQRVHGRDRRDFRRHDHRRDDHRHHGRH